MKKKFVKNFTRGNTRISRQKAFMRRVISRETGQILVLGCASGELCRWLAQKITPNAKIVGTDISPEYIALANHLYPHPRVEYRVGDALKEIPTGNWDWILFPDVYEHLPASERENLYQNLAKAMTSGTRILIFAPTPSEQRRLILQGWGLQPVDELVELDDYQELAQALHAEVTCFLSVSVNRKLDYNYVVIEKVAEVCPKLQLADKIPIRSWPEHPVLWNLYRKSMHVLFPTFLRRIFRTIQLAILMKFGRRKVEQFRFAAFLALFLFAGSALIDFSHENDEEAMASKTAISSLFETNRTTQLSELNFVTEMGDLRISPFEASVDLIDDDDFERIVSEFLDGQEDFFIVEDNDRLELVRLDSGNRLRRIGRAGRYTIYQEMLPAKVHS